MAISAKDVQKLREMTGVGMMDCKKALTEAEGNMDKAVEILREKGCDPGKLYLQSSYGVLNYPGLLMDYARFGIAMYGVLSSPDSRLLEPIRLSMVFLQVVK